MRNVLFFWCLLATVATAQPVLVASPSAHPSVYVASGTGQWEQQAARDLVTYIDRLSGSSALLNQEGEGFRIYVGRRALEEKPELKSMLEQVVKENPVVRADAIALLQDGRNLYLAGSNDDSHYYAAVELLRHWGCRWYFPTEFGECLPAPTELYLENYRHAYAPPFEVRTYWIAWNGDSTDYRTFARRNFYNLIRPGAGGGHALGRYTKKLPKDQPLTSPATVAAVVEQIQEKFGKGEGITLGMDDASALLKDDAEKHLAGGLRDKYFQTTVVSDVFMTFYNRVCGELLKRHPDSKAKIGFLAYVNLTLPPQKIQRAAEPLLCYLAPIDFDPNHSLDDPLSPTRQDYWGALKGWASVMEGRVIIYDYDQGMLVWRDLPNPSHHVIQKDIQHYRRAGILGFTTESRNAIATTFLNLHFRGQLYWNPDYSVEAGLAEFYPRFYGPHAAAMKTYWELIFAAWEKTTVVEHEFFVAPAVYTPELMKQLQQQIRLLPESSEDPILAQRLKFTHLSYQVLQAYVGMVELAAGRCRYAEAAELGARGLAAREQLTELSGIFTTYKRMPEKGPAWWPGEVELYRQLAGLGKVTELPLHWNFTYDPHDQGLWQSWGGGVPAGRRVRTDLYLQAQGVVAPDHHSLDGFGWYETEVRLPEGNWKIRFPGLFNSAWLYVNGVLVDHRSQHKMWWRNDYGFQWDVDLAGHTRPGLNRITLRVPMTLHLAGMFRRPFLYRKETSGR